MPWQRISGAQPRLVQHFARRDTPVERRTKYELVINLKVAKTIRLIIPVSLLLRAGDVIE
jgi:hypothetical protein